MLGTNGLVRYAAAAGEAALQRFSWPEAEHYLKVVLDHTPPGSFENASANHGLGRAFSNYPAATQQREALGFLQAAVDAYLRLDHIVEAIDAAKIPLAGGSIDHGGVELIDSVLPLAEQGSADEGWLLCRKAVHLRDQLHDSVGSYRLLDRSLEIARDRAIAIWRHGHWRTRHKVGS